MRSSTRRREAPSPSRSGRRTGGPCCRCATPASGSHPDDLPHIFERFYRADTARSHDLPGTGLGLAIARQIVDEAEGTIAAERAPGQGALFTVRLPAATRALPTP